MARIRAAHDLFPSVCIFMDNILMGNAIENESDTNLFHTKNRDEKHTLSKGHKRTMSKLSASYRLTSSSAPSSTSSAYVSSLQSLLSYTVFVTCSSVGVDG